MPVDSRHPVDEVGRALVALAAIAFGAATDAVGYGVTERVVDAVDAVDGVVA